MKLIIDKNSAIPVYHQIREQIKDDIHNGILKPNDMLLSERELCEELEISRMTVKQAMDSLMNEGLIYKKKGVGTFVSNPKIAQPLTKLTSFTNDMLNRGMKPGSCTITLSAEEPSSEIKKILKLYDEDKVIFIKRLRLADGEPMAVETTYLRYSICSQVMEEQLDNQSLYEILKKKCNVTIASAFQTIEIATCKSEDCKLLNIPHNKPVFFIKRITYDARNNPVEYVESAYRSDRYKFEIDLNV
jgi:GntR family transcriptional regulator